MARRTDVMNQERGRKGSGREYEGKEEMGEGKQKENRHEKKT